MGFPLLLRSILLILLLSLVQLRSYTSPRNIRLPGEPLALSVTDFGATGDGINYDSSAIQSAIDACNRHYTSYSSICRVTFPPGTYLTAKLHLRSGVLLDVTENAVLLGGPRLEDYPAETSSDWYVVVANNATDVGITGGGAIDGQGSKFVVRFDEKKNVMVSWNQTGACLGDEYRPRLVGFVDSRNVEIWNITLREPAYWWLVLNYTIHLLIDCFRRRSTTLRIKFDTVHYQSSFNDCSIAESARIIYALSFTLISRYINLWFGLQFAHSEVREHISPRRIDSRGLQHSK